MISRIFKQVYFRNELKIFNSLVKHDDCSQIQKSDIQVFKLKNILKISKNIPYYYPFLKDLDVENLSYSEFSTLPFLTKDILRNNKDELLNKNFKDFDSAYESQSGGSTGEPVIFMRTKKQAYFGAGNFHYANYLNGISPYSRFLVFWGAIQDMHRLKNYSIINKFKNFLTNSIMLNTFVLSDNIIYSYVKKINSYKPKVIKAYVHSIYDIAKYINKHNIKINCSPTIHTSTGPLYPEMRAEIQKAFKNSHIFSFYGSREVSAIATETLGGEDMVVLYDNVLLEIINKDGKPAKEGEEGEIVITTLNNDYMPLIRYKIGDRSVKNDSSSTFGTLKIKSVLGRTLGVIHKKDGTFIDGQFFTTLFFNNKSIKNFQLIQKSIHKCELKIIKSDSFQEVELLDIVYLIKKELGDVEIEIKFCDNIDLSVTGKIMYVFSELPHDDFLYNKSY